MESVKGQPNCYVMHFGDKWWSIPMHLDIVQLRACYQQDDNSSDQSRRFLGLGRLWSLPGRIYTDSGVHQIVARKLIIDKVYAVIESHYGDWLDEHPFDFSDLVFVVDSTVRHDEDAHASLRFVDRVMA